MPDAQKISLYSLADLKNTSDDAIPNYLNSLKFKQLHILSDVRLSIGYLAFAISAATLYWDWKLGFDSTKYYTAAAVAVYACLNGLLTFWIMYVEKGKVYVGTSPDGDKVEISTSIAKHVPIYNIKINYYKASNPSVSNAIKISRPFTLWFDGAGHFVALPFQQMFAAEVPMIGKADPAKAIAVGGKIVQTTPNTLDLQQGLDGIKTGHVTGTNLSENATQVTPRKVTKSKKKA